MYCGQCGKKVMDNMLFCPFCGSAIVIPDQDETPASPAPVSAEPATEDVQKAPAALEQAPAEDSSLFAADARAEAAAPAVEDVPEEVFEPLRFDFEIMQENAEAEAAKAPVQDVPVPEDPLEIAEEDVPQRRPAPRTQRPQPARKRSVNTYIPIKDIDPDDIFMDEDDDYDVDEDDDFEDGDSDFYYEDREEGSFLRRHIRGIVGLLLFLILAAICLFWANTDKGQQTLAQFNIAWRADAYAELGYAAYQQNNDLAAARYYEKAYAREQTNYDYAHSAMVAYYEAEEIELSAAMLKKCIAMKPDNAEPYKEMLILYPDPDKRPWEIKELIRQGYERTGNAALQQN